MSNFISNKFCKSNRNFFESKREINGQIKWGALQHWGAWQTTLHREVEEHDRECKLDHAPHNEKTAQSVPLLQSPAKEIIHTKWNRTSFTIFLLQNPMITGKETPKKVRLEFLVVPLFFFYKTSIFGRRPKNCLNFSIKSPQKTVLQLFSRWSINFYCLNLQTF